MVYDYYGTDMETGVSIDELAFEVMLMRNPTFPPLSVVQVQDNLDHLTEKVLGDGSDGSDGDGDEGDKS